MKRCECPAVDCSRPAVHLIFVAILIYEICMRDLIEFFTLKYVRVRSADLLQCGKTLVDELYRTSLPNLKLKSRTAVIVKYDDKLSSSKNAV